MRCTLNILCLLCAAKMYRNKGLEVIGDFRMWVNFLSTELIYSNRNTQMCPMCALCCNAVTTSLAQTPLLRFVVDLSKLCSKFSTNPQQIEVMEFGLLG